MFFGSMVFTPVRTESKPPGTDRVLNWAPYGLYQEQSYHLLSAEEVADKRKREKIAANRRYRGTPKGKEATRRYNASEAGKQSKRQYAASEAGKQSKRQYAASDVGKEKRSQYEASTDVGKEKRSQYEASDVGKEKRSQYEASEGRKESKMHTRVCRTSEAMCSGTGSPFPHSFATLLAPTGAPSRRLTSAARAPHAPL
jgi:hypothetical protein